MYPQPLLLLHSLSLSIASCSDSFLFSFFLFSTASTYLLTSFNAVHSFPFQITDKQTHKHVHSQQRCIFQQASLCFSSSLPSPSLIHSNLSHSWLAMVPISFTPFKVIALTITFLGGNNQMFSFPTSLFPLVSRILDTPAPTSCSELTDRHYHSTSCTAHSLNIPHPHRSRARHPELLLPFHCKLNHRPRINRRSRNTLQHHFLSSTCKYKSKRPADRIRHRVDADILRTWSARSICICLHGQLHRR